MPNVMTRKDHTSIGCTQTVHCKKQELKQKTIEFIAAIVLIVAGVSLVILTL